VLGYVAYWLYATGHSSGLRYLLHRHHHALWVLLSSGPWPLPRPPERLWACDASNRTIAAVDHLDRSLFIKKGPTAHIHYRELAALWLTQSWTRAGPPAGRGPTFDFGPAGRRAAGRLLISSPRAGGP
jgi:hypothetical protein